jgi:hypothetical protein
MDQIKFERISSCIIRYPDRGNWAIAKNLSKVTAHDVAEVRATMAGELGQPIPEDSTEKSQIEAIPLNQKRVMPQKPQGSDCRRRIRDIKRGVCHRVPAFAAFLGISEDTLRRHAKALGCLKWVEMTPDNFEEAVMNPDTAKAYMR